MIGLILVTHGRLADQFVEAMEDVSDLPQGFFDGALAEYLFGRATSIYGGTNEIQREILAKATLDTLQ